MIGSTRRLGARYPGTGVSEIDFKPYASVSKRGPKHWPVITVFHCCLWATVTWVCNGAASAWAAGGLSGTADQTISARTKVATDKGKYFPLYRRES